MRILIAGLLIFLARDPRLFTAAVGVVGRFKLGQSWALQNPQVDEFAVTATGSWPVFKRRNYSSFRPPTRWALWRILARFQHFAADSCGRLN